MTEGEKLNLDKLSYVDLKAVLGGNSWFMKDMNILGLSPRGSFANYLMASYGDSSNNVNLGLFFLPSKDETM